MRKRPLEKFTGCLIGGAVGDALGYAVEFSTLESIRRRYGDGGIRCYDLVCGMAIISDDTQMTLFTANGLLVADTLAKRTGTNQPAVVSIWKAYLDWFKTQEYGSKPAPGHTSWLFERPELHSARAPGNTCLHALGTGKMGTIEAPLNRSKGCGGVMRVAPIGLFYDSTEMPIAQICDIGAAAAAITHGHPLGYISAEVLVFIINSIVYGRHDDWLGGGLKEIVYDCRNYLMLRYPDNKHAGEMVELINKAIYLACQNTPVTEAIKELGEGWVGEEAIAIAIYCSLKFPTSFEDAVIAAVNHDGDSDSTGAITGNIMGAYLGIDGIPERFKKPLELRQITEQLAEDLQQGCPRREDKNWDIRYYRT